MSFTKSCLLKASGILLFSFVFSFGAFAQVPTPDPGPPDNPPIPDDVPVPITGIEILLISGASLGGYKLIKNRKTSQNT